MVSRETGGWSIRYSDTQTVAPRSQEDIPDFWCLPRYIRQMGQLLRGPKLFVAWHEPTPSPNLPNVEFVGGVSATAE